MKLSSAQKGYLIIENGPSFEGRWRGGEAQAGEVVFNTSHSGYEEMATDPSYFSQILVTTAPQQGNYSVDRKVWESENIWIRGFVCLEMQSSERDSGWLRRLSDSRVPVLTDIDTRSLVIYLRSQGTKWGAVVAAETEPEARKMALSLIERSRGISPDWTRHVCRRVAEDIVGQNARGPRVAVIDFGAKENILRELKMRVREMRVFPSNTTAEEIKAYKPDGIMLTNGPGDPAEVKEGLKAVKALLGYRFIFGICMGHQVLSLALGAKTYKLRFGHRGSNHPIRDQLLQRVYMTSQNHGYNVDRESLPEGVEVTHINLNDNTVAGIAHSGLKCMSVQFHPESHPGPHDSTGLFDYFIKQMT
jgi:carbamoyl-phosphate synthase small subunit